MGPFSFKIHDISSYTRVCHTKKGGDLIVEGGRFIQNKQPVNLNFLPLREAAEKFEDVVFFDTPRKVGVVVVVVEGILVVRLTIDLCDFVPYFLYLVYARGSRTFLALQCLSAQLLLYVTYHPLKLLALPLPSFSNHKKSMNVCIHYLFPPPSPPPYSKTGLL